MVVSAEKRGGDVAAREDDSQLMKCDLVAYGKRREGGGDEKRRQSACVHFSSDDGESCRAAPCVNYSPA